MIRHPIIVINCCDLNWTAVRNARTRVGVTVLKIVIHQNMNISRFCEMPSEWGHGMCNISEKL